MAAPIITGEPISSALLTAGSFLAPVVGGIIGRIASRGDRRKAEQAMQDAIAEIEKLGVPPELYKDFILDKFNSVGILSPELEDEITVGVSQAAQVQEDPALRGSQVQALEMLKERGRAGLTAEDRAALSKIRRDVEGDRSARLERVKQSMAERGLSGSGAELAASLSAAQGGANLQQEEGERVAAEASRRALDALTRGADLASGIRGQDLTANTQRAQAADEFKKFDTANAVNRQTRNVASKNLAMAQNLENAQNIANRNVEMQNAQRAKVEEAKRQKYLDNVERAKLGAGAKQGLANIYGGKAADTAQMAQGIGSGVGNLAAAYQATRKPAAPALPGISANDADDSNEWEELMKRMRTA